MTTSDLDDDEGANAMANALSDNFRLRRLHTSPSSESLCGFDEKDEREREREREREKERERETRN